MLIMITCWHINAFQNSIIIRNWLSSRLNAKSRSTDGIVLCLWVHYANMYSSRCLFMFFVEYSDPQMFFLQIKTSHTHIVLLSLFRLDKMWNNLPLRLAYNRFNINTYIHLHFSSNLKVAITSTVKVELIKNVNIRYSVLFSQISLITVCLIG